MSSLPAQLGTSRNLPSLQTIAMTTQEREQLHIDAKNMQQYLCTAAPRNQFGREECDFMLAALDICSHSCTQEQADTDLKEVLGRIERIVK